MKNLTWFSHLRNNSMIRCFPWQALLFMFLVACSSAQVMPIRPVSESTPEPHRESSITHTPTPLVGFIPTLHSPQPSPTPETVFRATSTAINIIPHQKDILPGQYIVFYALDLSNPDQNLVTFEAVSFDGETVRTIALLEENSDGNISVGRISPDGKKIAYKKTSPCHELIVIDLETMGRIKIFSPANLCSDLSWSPDSQKLLALCGDIYVYSFADKSFLPLLTLSDSPAAITSIAWSPDGEWILSRLQYTNVFNEELGGELLLTDTACLSDFATCPDQTRLLEKFRSDFQSPTWSPDSHSLAAIINPREVGIWNLEGHAYLTMRVPNLERYGFLMDRWGYLSWSPDGEWLAYSNADLAEKDEVHDDLDIHIISITGEQHRLVLDDRKIKLVMGWLLIPWQFEVGDAFVVTTEGKDLRIRETPSLEGNILKRMVPGETVIIAEGIIKADGFAWWKIRTETGLEGWAANNPDWYIPVQQTSPTETVQP